jgi:hypothetical protein
MQIAINVLRVVHIVTAVLMSWPFHALVVVNERGRLGPPVGDRADHYMENIIKSQTTRCFAFQLTVLLSGGALLILRGMGLGTIFTDWIVGAKFFILLAIMGLLSSVHFTLQPRIDEILRQAGEGSMPADQSAEFSALRGRRKRMASICLFGVLVDVMLGLQVFGRFDPILTVILLALIVLFVWRAYRGPLRFGWV